MDAFVPLVIVGDVKGDLDKAIKKLLKVKKTMSTPECEGTILVCGDFFGDIPPSCKEYITGSKKVPIHIYVLGPVAENQSEVYSKFAGDMCDIMTNVTHLGKYGVLSLTGGLTVAYLSGVESAESKLWTFTEEIVDNLIKKCRNFPKIDVLITYQWPKGVEKARPESNVTVSCSSKLICKLVTAIMPRTHFASYEQISFSTPHMAHEGNSCTTVFYGLTSLDKYKDGKWVYGIRLPLVDRSVNQAISLPFSPEKEVNGVFFDTSSSSKRKGSSSESDLRKRRNIDLVVDPESCWFCMGNPDIDRSLIIAVADHVYLTLAKGPVVQGHVIILPIKHIEKMTDAPSGVEIETHRFLEAMSQYYETLGKQLVWFERCYKSPHLQINAIPVDPSLLARGVIDKNLTELALQKHLEAKLFNLRTVVNLRKNITSPYYFYLQIGADRGYLIDINKESDFPVNFGRKIIAQALGVPEREFWKNCIEDEPTVARSVFRFTEGFEPFNFTLTD
uniref:CWF19-like protein 1 n=2 Tax=Lygus hesperus TaxID=30085 RepID=A0A0A9X7F4_LYGHE